MDVRLYDSSCDVHASDNDGEFAALNVLDGTVLAHCAPRKRHTEFVVFLNQLDRTIPPRREVHLILDNYATHTHPKVEAWFAAHLRYHRHFVPTSASWLNLIERWFAEITRKRIRRGTFRSVAELIRAIEDYVTHHNRHAKPFGSSHKCMHGLG